ncbi:MAG: hypothetical protein ACODAU_01555 [Myxococcota bacterium]
MEAIPFGAVGLVLFMVACIAVGLRLIRLWRITHLLPELLLAVALLGTGFLGFALEAAARMVPDLPELARLGLVLAGLSGEYLGAFALFVFVRRVFRPQARWAAVLAWLGGALLVTAVVGECASGQYLRYIDREPSRGPFVPLGIAARGLAPLWTALESFRYHRMLRRRVRIGLADPMVVHRVALWGTATAASLAAHVVAVAHRVRWGTALEADPWALNLVSALALVAATCIALAFFPPATYRQWVRRRGAPASG